MENRKNNRLKKELQLIAKEKDQFNVRVNEHDFSIWYIDFVGPQDSVYAGEKYT